LGAEEQFYINPNRAIVTLNQTAAITILRLFKDYKVVVLGDRTVVQSNGSWLAEQKVYFALRLKKNEVVLIPFGFSSYS